ncbi:MAG: GDSL-type esterase/lipase family protein [Flavobacteriales bacterium]
MQQIRPYKVLLFLILVLSLLCIPSYLIPSKGVEWLGINWKFLPIDRVWIAKKQVKKNIDQIVKSADTASINDGIKHNGKSNGQVGIPDGLSASFSSEHPLALSPLAALNLARFFEALDGATAQKISIFHYGDSQIEGDRMTGYIRQRLQQQFGGVGPGFIPAYNVYQTQSFKQRVSPNFKRYTAFWPPKMGSRKYGALLSAATFSLDSSKSQQQVPTEAWIELEPSASAFSRARTYSQVKFYYNSCFKPCAVKVYENNKLIHEDSLIADGGAHLLPLSFDHTPSKLKYVFSSLKSPIFSGFSLEGDLGVQVNNVAMRGSSGHDLSSSDAQLFGQMHRQANTKLIILQFGGNSVHTFKDSSGVRYYVGSLKNRIQYLQKMVPGAAIVLIGPSDMSRLNEGVFESYPLLPYTVERMRKMCAEQGVAFWDLYGAMGGLNSMPAWVAAGLAGKDYIHFSPRGASIASQHFYEALMTAYSDWKQNSAN